MFNLLVFLLVFRCCLGFSGCFTGKFETFFDGAEELTGNVVAVVQGGDDVGRARNGLELKTGKKARSDGGSNPSLEYISVYSLKV
jgi:hypothetical protein